MNSMVRGMVNRVVNSMVNSRCWGMVDNRGRGMMSTMVERGTMSTMVERGSMGLNMVMSRSGMMDNMSSSMVNWMVDGVGRVNRMVDGVNGVDWVDNRYSSNFYFNFARSLFYINNSNWLDYCWSRGKVESWKGSWNWEGGKWGRLSCQDNGLGYPSSKSSSKSKWNGSTD